MLLVLVQPSHPSWTRGKAFALAKAQETARRRVLYVEPFVLNTHLRGKSETPSFFLAKQGVA